MTHYLLPHTDGHGDCIGFLFNKERLLQERSRGPLFVTAVKEYFARLRPISDSDGEILRLSPDDWKTLARMLRAEIYFVPGFNNIVHLTYRS